MITITLGIHRLFLIPGRFPVCGGFHIFGFGFSLLVTWNRFSV